MMQALAIATDRGPLTFTALRIQSSYIKKPTRVCFSNFDSFPKSRLLSRSSKPIVPVLVTASSSSSSWDDEDWDLDYDVLKNLNPAVRKRVKVLILIEKQYNELKAKFIEERSALEAKYLKLYQPLFTKRYEVVNGEEKGVSNFWLTVLKNNEVTGKHITEQDEGALKYLKDIKWSFLEESQGPGFKLEFCFDQKNPYFKNTVLTKEYYIRRPYFDWNLSRTKGTTNIEWYPGKRLISELSTNYQDFVSFFNFFSPARHGICFLHNWEDMAKDVTFGLIIKHKIISHAVSWFTGGHNEKHVEVLREIQKQYDELEAKYLDERAALEAKYDKLYQPLYTKRYEIVNGVVEVEGVTSEHGEDKEKGVPNFWLNALKSSAYGFFAIKERDEGALKYLKDIKWTRIEEEGAPNWWSMPDELKWCKIEFFFDQKKNPYFKNSVLTKTYHMVDGDVCHCLKKAIGTEIEWYPGNCLTTRTEEEVEEEDFASFFDFFSPPPDHYEEFLIALAFNYQIILGAVSLFLNPVPATFMKTMTIIGKKSSASQDQ